MKEINIENIKKLPNDVKMYLSKFIFFQCSFCKNKLYLKNELTKCNYCNNQYCKQHTIDKYTCSVCLETELMGILGNFNEYIHSHCTIT